MSLTLQYRVNSPGGRSAIFLDKSKEIVYILMGEHTQSAGFI